MREGEGFLWGDLEGLCRGGEGRGEEMGERERLGMCQMESIKSVERGAMFDKAQYFRINRFLLLLLPSLKSTSPI